MNIITDFAPILILVFIIAFCVATAIILNIRSRKSLLDINDNDFIDEIIIRKKRKINANIGGITWTEYVTVIILMPIAFGLFSYYFISPKPLCIVFIVLGLFVPDLFIYITNKKQKKKFEELYARSLKTLASSLRSGLSIEQAIDNVANNPFIDDTIRDGYKQISSDIKVGISLEDAFIRFAKDSNSEDAKDVASAITMQSEVGGSEAEVITNIAQNINDRIMTRKEIKTMFADTSILILAMDFLPILVIGMLYFGSPQFIEPYFESPSMTLVFIGLIAVTVIGSIVIRYMANIAKGVKK